MLHGFSPVLNWVNRAVFSGKLLPSCLGNMKSIIFLNILNFIGINLIFQGDVLWVAVLI